MIRHVKPELSQPKPNIWEIGDMALDTLNFVCVNNEQDKCIIQQSLINT